MIQQYVECIHPGIVVSETSIKKIPDRNIKNVLPLSDNTFGFRFFEREEVKSDDEILTGKSKNYSNWYYVGKKMNAKQIQSERPKRWERVLENMGDGEVLLTKFGQYIPLKENDVVI